MSRVNSQPDACNAALDTCGPCYDGILIVAADAWPVSGSAVLGPKQTGRWLVVADWRRGGPITKRGPTSQGTASNDESMVLAEPGVHRELHHLQARVDRVLVHEGLVRGVAVRRPWHSWQTHYCRQVVCLVNSAKEAAAWFDAAHRRQVKAIAAASTSHDQAGVQGLMIHVLGELTAVPGTAADAHAPLDIVPVIPLAPARWAQSRSAQAATVDAAVPELAWG
jgi:hypothetical protein